MLFKNLPQVVTFILYGTDSTLYYISLVVMVTGGEGANSSVRMSAELLSRNGTRLCSLPSLPKRPKYLLSQTGLLICGFFNRNSKFSRCHTFSDGKWTMTHKLGHKRGGHAAWASPQGVLIMGGKLTSKVRSFTREWKRPGIDTSTELLTDNGGTTPSFNLANKV